VPTQFFFNAFASITSINNTFSRRREFDVSTLGITNKQVFWILNAITVCQYQILSNPFKGLEIRSSICSQAFCGKQKKWPKTKQQIHP
jgi:hypothetical protein